MIRKRPFIIAFFTIIVLLSPFVIRPRLDKEDLLKRLPAANINADDIALIARNLEHLSTSQLQSMLTFLTDALVFADSRYFEISAYSNWEEYNFQRPAGDVVLTNLARRDLFLDPARQLNNLEITNMSAEALAALAFSQTSVEEKWDHTVPWDGDANAVFNWIQPELLVRPEWEDFVAGDFLYRERVRYWFATFDPSKLEASVHLDFSDGNDVQAALVHIGSPVPNVPRLAGYSYPIGNQLYLQTAESLLWYSDYVTVSFDRYGFSPQGDLDTAIDIPQDSAAILSHAHPADWQFAKYQGLWGLLHAPFAEELRRELIHPETAAFWNVMRFLHAGARQREGGGSDERPGDNQPAIMALRYTERSAMPQGRARQDISAFSLITTVYSGSILLDFTNWSAATQDLIVAPIDLSRSDGIHRRLSERNKAIRVIEHLGDENVYSNATHVSGSNWTHCVWFARPWVCSWRHSTMTRRETFCHIRRRKLSFSCKP